ncbi:phosphomannomutase/phosphoglucomutase [Methylophilus aquaticus]|uniref:Phosphomannomutase/phosphoglucomutase n=1 Tax=Methylophilus aquaticus TaxID=1971610 RepID=A0ABT9JVV2_9PROT|nr:phosphomannomutase/phosphoglucomutase [Methylophilus aquaticus]MDP8568271.1 phosphomannomutase/phosphoglucomutase [Methylophilus aquaticus]
MQSAPLLPASIFKAYDIRGIVDDTLTTEIVYQIGLALGSLAQEHGEQRLCIGYDGRLSSPALAAALGEGVLHTGTDVISLGMVTTPMLYFATHHLPQTRSGIMITGSHNPPQYNGIKMVIAGHTLSSEAIQALRQRILARQFRRAPQAGQLATHDIAAAYQQTIVRDIQLTRPMRVVIDCGNGVAGAFAPALFKALGCEVETLFCEVDGHFPNHHPDPVEAKNLQDIIARLRLGEAEIGLAFDGDGDRLGVVTKQGHIIRSDRQLMLFIEDVLAQQLGSPVVFDVKSTRHLSPWIKAHGGKPVIWKTGHSLMKAKIHETGAAIGGELSGHLFFNDSTQGKPRWFGFDDGLYSAARLLEIVSRSADASAVLDAIPDSVNTPELQIAMAEGEPHALINSLQQSAHFADAVEVITIDGLRVEYADGFGLIRASNTTPVLTLRFEADTETALERIQEAFKQQLNSHRPDLKIPF